MAGDAATEPEGFPSLSKPEPFSSFGDAGDLASLTWARTGRLREIQRRNEIANRLHSAVVSGISDGASMDAMVVAQLGRQNMGLNGMYGRCAACS